MRPWTTRTVQMAVVAAGFAAVGTGTASAAQAPDVPDLSTVPDDIGFTAPADACRIQEGPGYGPTKAPCVDAQLHASSPNVIKKVGADIATTAHDVAGDLQDGRPPLSAEKVNRVLGHVASGANDVQRLTKTRPTVGVKATPEHVGLFQEKHPGSGRLVDAEVGPREPGHEGVSAVDTAVDATVMQGFRSTPLNPVGAVTPALQDTPLQDEPVTLPVERIAPIAGQVPGVRELGHGPGAAVRDAAGTLGQQLSQSAQPVTRMAGQLPLN